MSLFMDFNYGTQPDEVAVYDYDNAPPPANADYAAWDSSRVAFDRRPSVAEIRAYGGDQGTGLTLPNSPRRIITGGFGLFRKTPRWSGGFLYGTLEMRMRSIPDPPGRKEVKHVALTYPQIPDPEGWPRDGEVDFMEDGGGDRKDSTFTLHFYDPAAVTPDNPKGHRQIQRPAPRVDRTKFQVWGFNWTPGRLLCLLNGSVYGTIEGPMVPSVAHVPIVQTESCDFWDGKGGDRATLEVDWIRVTDQ